MTDPHALADASIPGPTVPSRSPEARRRRPSAAGRTLRRSRVAPRLEWLEVRTLLSNAPTIIPVTSNADTGTGTLRAAIQSLDSSDASMTIIQFNLPSNELTITPKTTLPAITAPVEIEGQSEPGFVGTPLVVISGSSAPTGTSGLTLVAGSSGSIIQELVVNQFTSRDGIDLASSDDLVAACDIGTTAGGGSAAGNQYGIAITGTGCTIGGTQSGAGDVISGSTLDGIEIEATSCLVEGDLIGTNAAGSAPIANDVGIDVDATGATIGGTAPSDADTISGNTSDGLIIEGGAASCLVAGNLIGANASGATISNAVGILVECIGATIGGSASGDANTIAGNTKYGIDLSAGQCLVAGNLIGTNANDSKTLGNKVGIYVGAIGATIGGTVSGDANTIAGNTKYGIDIAASCLVVGNGIGTNATDSTPLGNRMGIYVGATGATIGGSASGDANIISGNTYLGIYIEAASCLVEGDAIGTNASGSAPIANDVGIDVGEKGTGATIGGSASGDANTISGNATVGIGIDSSSCLAEGNWIGTNASGSTDIGNDDIGIYIGATGATIGGSASGDANTIAGNKDYGIYIAESCLVEGNWIGTNASGATDIGDGVGMIIGVEGETIGGTAATIGGTAAGDANTIAGNTKYGIDIVGVLPCLVEGNAIGTNASGSAPIANGVGIEVGQTGATIGGTAAGAGNVISGNSSDGIDIDAPCLVEGNRIGTDETGTNPVPNRGSGVFVESALTGEATIGVAGVGNLIAFNDGPGVAVATGTTGVATIRYNSIFENGGPGIDLGDDGVTPDTEGDADNTPLLGTTAGGTLSGSLNAAPDSLYVIDFYGNPSSDASASRPQGRTDLGSTTVLTDAQGDASFAFAFAPNTFESSVTATATGPSGTTSEFSPPVTLTAPAAGTTFDSTAGVPFQGAVASFTAPLPTDTSADFTATINWGDGTPSTAGTVVAGADGFVVLGSHTFATADPADPVTVTITDLPDDAQATIASLADVAAYPLTATGATLAATANVPFQGTVASFTSGDPTATPADFTATINYGDGTPTVAGTILAAPGGFIVVGSHTYSSVDPDVPVTVTITDTRGYGQAIASGLANVAAPSDVVTAYGRTANFVAGTLYSAVVASFTDSNVRAIAGQFTATINWGDGSAPSVGTISIDGAGFDVNGSHTYNFAGTDAITVTIDDLPTSTTVTAAATATVAPVPITIQPKNFAVTPGTAFSVTVATFTDANPLTNPGFYDVTINWGDGTSSTWANGTSSTGVTITGSNPFTVSGTHSYQAGALSDQGTAIVTITITDPNGQTATAVSRAVDPPTTADPSSTGAAPTSSPAATPAAPTVALAVQAAAISVPTDRVFSGVVATFTDGDAAGPSVDRVVIDWGKGRRTAGMITGSNGRFVVMARHVFPRFRGTKPVTITVTDPDGQTVSVSETASEVVRHSRVIKVTARGKDDARPIR
jgi:hypothetical protein